MYKTRLFKFHVLTCKYYFISIFFCVFLAIISIKYSLNTDFNIYNNWYVNLFPFNISSCAGVEILFCGIGLIFYFFNFDFYFFAFSFIFATYFIVSIFVFQNLKIHNNIWYLIGGFVIFFCLFLRPNMASHLIRQYFASSLLLISILVARRSLAIAIVVLASFVHASALIFIIPLFFSNEKNISKVFLYLAGGAVIIAPFSEKLYIYTFTLISKILIEFSYFNSRLIYNIWYKAGLYFNTGVDISFSRITLVFIAYFCSLILMLMGFSKKLFYYFSIAVVILLITHNSSPLIFERFFHYTKFFIFSVLLNATSIYFFRLKPYFIK